MKKDQFKEAARLKFAVKRTTTILWYAYCLFGLGNHKSSRASGTEKRWWNRCLLRTDWREIQEIQELQFHWDVREDTQLQLDVKNTLVISINDLGLTVLAFYLLISLACLFISFSRVDDTKIATEFLRSKSELNYDLFFNLERLITSGKEIDQEYNNLLAFPVKLVAEYLENLILNVEEQLIIRNI